jgi:HAD superfamily hydrolase (TIGR01549 family)
LNDLSQETLIPNPQLLKDLKAKYCKMAIVTGRPRKDALKFLKAFNIADFFDAVVCMEDTAKPKPDPAPVKLAMSQLAVRKAVLIGDTHDDLNASTLSSMLCISFLVLTLPQKFCQSVH